MRFAESRSQTDPANPQYPLVREPAGSTRSLGQLVNSVPSPLRSSNPHPQFPLSPNPVTASPNPGPKIGKSAKNKLKLASA
jgi:hypothetical protein